MLIGFWYISALFCFISIFDKIVTAIINQDKVSNCTFKTLSFSPVLHLPTDFRDTISSLLSDGFNISNEENYASNTRKLLKNNSEWIAIIISKPPLMPLLLMKQSNGRINISKNRTKETQWYWKYSDDGVSGWNVPFRDCFLTNGQWINAYFASDNLGSSVTIFSKLKLNRCDKNLRELFNSIHQCDEKTTQCIPIYDSNIIGDYKCICKRDYYYPTAKADWNGVLRKDIEKSSLNNLPNKCYLCPKNCKNCEQTSLCLYEPNVLLRQIIFIIQLVLLIIIIIVSVIVVVYRKDKVVEIYLLKKKPFTGVESCLGEAALWLATVTTVHLSALKRVILHLINGFETICIIESWFKELGFILCYGSIYLKLYKHLTEFRTRKAHRWVIKNLDLLKYLTVMVSIICAYMFAYSTFIIQLKLESDFNLLKIHSDFAKKQFEENRFLSGAVINEFLMTLIFSIIQYSFYATNYYSPDFVLVMNFCRCHLSTTSTFLLIFVPKLIYQAQYNKLKNESANDNNANVSLSAANSDGDISAVSLAHVDPEIVKVELKRLYNEIEQMREKCLQYNNPHISRKKSGSKSIYRKFSLQEKKRKQSKISIKYKDSNEHQSPEDSVFSIDGQTNTFPHSSPIVHIEQC